MFRGSIGGVYHGVHEDNNENNALDGIPTYLNCSTAYRIHRIHMTSLGHELLCAGTLIKFRLIQKSNCRVRASTQNIGLSGTYYSETCAVFGWY